MKLISLVIPLYNEEEVVEQSYVAFSQVMKITGYLYELIFVNDGSEDQTLVKLRKATMNDPAVRIIDFARNFGHQAAVSAGINKAIGDAIVIIDADLQDPPRVILDMLTKWEEGYDIVYGRRLNRKGETLFKIMTAKYFYKFLNTMSDVDIPHDTGDFRLIDKKIAYIFNKMTEKNRFIRGMISWIGFKQTYVEYDRDERFAGVTKYSLSKMMRFASDGIISFSSKPLKFIMRLGFFMVVFAFFLFIYSLSAKIFNFPTVPGWTSLMTVITLFSGVQMLSLGIIGEYITWIVWAIYDGWYANKRCSIYCHLCHYSHDRPSLLLEYFKYGL